MNPFLGRTHFDHNNHTFVFKDGTGAVPAEAQQHIETGLDLLAWKIERDRFEKEQSDTGAQTK